MAFVTWFLIGGSVATAQVGIGTTVPNSNAVLDVSTDIAEGGLLIPRVVLTSATAKYPPGGEHVMGMIVYNYEHWGTGPDAVSPGFYYNSGSRWIRIAEDTGSQAEGWLLQGNINVGVNDFFGTRNNRDLRIKTNNSDRFEFNTVGQLVSYSNGAANTPSYSFNNSKNSGMFSPTANTLAFSTNANEAMRIDANRRMMIFTTTPISNTRLTVNETGANRSIYGNSASGEGVRGEATTGTGVIGLANTGIGVWGVSTGNGVGGFFRGQHNNAFGIQGSGGDNPVYYFNNTGTGAALTGSVFGITSFATSNSNGTGIIGVGNDGEGIVHNQGSGVAGVGRYAGVFGYAFGVSGNTFGGWFESDFDGLAVVGGWLGNTRYKIFGEGEVSTIVKDHEKNPVIMFAPEAPEVLLQDYGIGALKNGEARIELDPILSKNIQVSDNHPLKVFIQLEGDCKGVFVTDKSRTGFTVKELQGGNSNVDFSWQIIATRANEKVKGKDGSYRISDHTVRFPLVPKEFLNSTSIKNKVSKQQKENLESSSLEPAISPTLKNSQSKFDFIDTQNKKQEKSFQFNQKN